MSSLKASDQAGHKLLKRVKDKNSKVYFPCNLEKWPADWALMQLRVERRHTEHSLSQSTSLIMPKLIARLLYSHHTRFITTQLPMKILYVWYDVPMLFFLLLTMVIPATRFSDIQNFKTKTGITVHLPYS